MLFLGQCSQQCASTSCLLVEEEQKETDRQNTDIQSTRHVLVCLLLTVNLLAVSTVNYFDIIPITKSTMVLPQKCMRVNNVINLCFCADLLMYSNMHSNYNT